MTIFVDGVEHRLLLIDGAEQFTVSLDGVLLASPPAITTQPVGGTVTDIDAFDMSIASNNYGATTYYQWLLNGTAISGANSTSYQHPPSPVGTYTYTCAVDGFSSTNTITGEAVVTVNSSWSGNTTITKDFIDYGNGTSEWGYISIILGANLGDLDPNNVNGNTFLKISTFVSAEPTYVDSLWVDAPYPSGSTITLEVSASESYVATSEGTAVFLFTSDVRSWMQTEETVPIYLSGIAATEAARIANDLYTGDGSETRDDYLIRWGVHVSQRPDLYQIQHGGTLPNA